MQAYTQRLEYAADRRAEWETSRYAGIHTGTGIGSRKVGRDVDKQTCRHQHRDRNEQQTGRQIWRQTDMQASAQRLEYAADRRAEM